MCEEYSRGATGSYRMGLDTSLPRASEGAWLCRHLDLELQASRTGREYISAVKPPSLWCIVMAALRNGCTDSRGKAASLVGSPAHENRAWRARVGCLSLCTAGDQSVAVRKDCRLCKCRQALAPAPPCPGSLSQCHLTRSQLTGRHSEHEGPSQLSAFCCSRCPGQNKDFHHSLAGIHVTLHQCPMLPADLER